MCVSDRDWGRASACGGKGVLNRSFNLYCSNHTTEQILPRVFCCTTASVARQEVLRDRNWRVNFDTLPRGTTEGSFSTERLIFQLTVLSITAMVARMETRVCESSECRKEFDPVNGRQHFCSNSCKSRENMRRMRARRRLHVCPDPPNPPDPRGPQHRDVQGAEAGIMLSRRRKPAVSASVNSQPGALRAAA